MRPRSRHVLAALAIMPAFAGPAGAVAGLGHPLDIAAPSGRLETTDPFASEIRLLDRDAPAPSFAAPPDGGMPGEDGTSTPPAMGHGAMNHGGHAGHGMTE